MLQKRVNLFGLFVDDVSLEGALSLALDSLNGGIRRSFFTPNLEMLEGARKSEGARRLLNTASVSLPDGYGLFLVAKLLGANLKNTVGGIDFGEKLLELASRGGRGVFLLGSREGVAQRAAYNLRQRYENLKICGSYHGYFGADELDLVLRKINSSGAEILIVCRGFPRQERFVCEAKNRLGGVKIFACLGGSLDVWAGEVSRAPKCFRRAHLEWLWRIMREPERLSRFVLSLPVLLIALGEWAKKSLAFVGNGRINHATDAYNQTDARAVVNKTNSL